MIRYLGNIRGAVRISIGLATTIADIEKFICFTKMLLNKTIDEAIPDILNWSMKISRQYTGEIS